MSSGDTDKGAMPSVDLDNDKLYEKLRAHTEKLLAEQYTRLHDQFQSQLDQVLGKLRAPPRTESITVRASIEGNTAPVVVSTSTGLRTNDKSLKGKKEKKKLSKIPPHLASRYLSPAPMLVPKIPTLLKKTAKPLSDEIPVTSTSNSDHQMTMYNKVKTIDLNLSEEEQSKFPSVTKAFLRKSMYFLNDIQNLDNDKPLNKPKTATGRKPANSVSHSNNKSRSNKSRPSKSAPSKLVRDKDEVFEVDEDVELLQDSNHEADEEVPFDDNTNSDNVEEIFAGKTLSDTKGSSKTVRNDTNNNNGKNRNTNSSTKEKNNTDTLPPRPKQSRPVTSPVKSSVPKEWTDLRLDLHSTTNASGKDDHLLSNVARQWENQVAKHVLSLFASHKMHTGNHKEGRDILLCADIHDEENRHTVQADINVHSNTMFGTTNSNSNSNEAASIKTSPASKFMEKRIGLSRAKTSDSGIRVKQRLLTADGEDFEKVFSKFRSCHVITTRAGEQVALRGSPKVAPIWFVANGDIFSDWSFLPGGNNLQAQLNVMYENRLLVEYVDVLKTIIIDLYRVATGTKTTKLAVTKKESLITESPKKKKLESTKWDDNANTVTPNALYSPPPSPTDAPPPHSSDTKYSPDQVREIFRKLIISSNSMAMLAISKKQEDMACRLIQVVESYIHQDGILPKSARDDLNALIYTTWGYYFYKKKKFSSAMTFTRKALELYESLENKECVAMCLTQLAAASTLLSRPKEGHQLLYQFITMLEDGRLSVANSEARELCICAIAYHNLAVIQLKLLVPDLAIKSAQSARKIARLCISYSSRWGNVFQHTYDAALDDINFHLASGKLYDSESLKFLSEITKEYFHPVPDEEQNIIIDNGKK